MNVADYIIDANQVIGVGYSFVVQSMNKKDNSWAAAKLFEVDRDVSLGLYENESKILRYLNAKPHSNIIQMKASNIINNVGVIVMEQLDSDFLDLLIDDKLSVTQKMKIYVDTCKAVKHCHDNDVAHLDIKPENILVNIHNMDVKLADFGTSQIMNDDDKVYNVTGTIEYSPPEVLNSSSKSIDGKKVDMWGLGMLLHVLLTGVWPLRTGEKQSLNSQITDGKIILSSDLSKDYSKLILSLLSLKPSERPSISDLLSSPILKPWRT